MKQLLSISAMLLISIASNAQSDSVFVHDESEYYPLCEKIYGDFDGDGEQELAYLTYPAIHDSEGFVICPANPVTYINFSKESIPTLKVEDCTGGHLQNLGDLNDDHRDEIGLWRGWPTSNIHYYTSWRLKGNEWCSLTEPVFTHMALWERLGFSFRPIKKAGKNRLVIWCSPGYAIDEGDDYIIVKTTIAKMKK